jgi:hypothetical protein
MGGPVATDIVVPASNYLNEIIVSSPTAPSSTTLFTMQGLSVGQASVTPQNTGNFLFSLCGYLISSATTAARGFIGQLSYGTGTIPTSNHALTGTQIGSPVNFEIGTTLTSAADLATPFHIQAIATGLSMGTNYWVDLAAKAIGAASIVSLKSVTLDAIELS